MVLIQIIFTLCKIILNYSSKSERLGKLLNMNLLKSSMENFQENVFLTNEFKDSDATSLEYHSIIVQKIFEIIIQEELILNLFIIVVDLNLAKCLSNITNFNNLGGKKAGNKLIEIIYLFNPFTLFGSKNIFDRFYTLIVLLGLKYNNNAFIGPMIFAFGLISNSNGLLLINLIFFILLTKQVKITFIINLILSLIILTGISIYFRGNIMVYNHYLNYFVFLKDTFPSLTMYWYLIPETFLKYQYVSVIMIIILQFLLSYSIIVVTQKAKYHNKLTLYFALIFGVNFLLDRYTTSNDYIIFVLLLVPHSDIFKGSNNYEMSIAFLIEGFMILFFRSYQYFYSNLSSSNLLYFHNLSISIIVVGTILVYIYSMNIFNRKNFIGNIVEDIIDKSLKKCNQIKN